MNLILGAANFGNDYGKRLEQDECFAILNRAKSLGIWAVDTAQSYGDSANIIQGWGGGLKIFSKYKRGETYPAYADYVLLHDEKDVNSIDMENDGASLYDPKLAKAIHYPSWIQGPLNPLNLSFLYYAGYERFIARSVFCGGRLQRSNQEDIATLIFGFLKSHCVKQVVIGVESITELENIVRIAFEK